MVDDQVVLRIGRVFTHPGEELGSNCMLSGDRQQCWTKLEKGRIHSATCGMARIARGCQTDLFFGMAIVERSLNHRCRNAIGPGNSPFRSMKLRACVLIAIVGADPSSCTLAIGAQEAGDVGCIQRSTKVDLAFWLLSVTK